jgi:2-iminobutanoate/2-iminopropanoate deaminase
MPRFFNARRNPLPAVGTSHGVAHAGNARRLIIAPQFGLHMDGSLPDKLDIEIEMAWSNLQNVLAEGGMGIGEVVRLVTYVTDRSCLLPASNLRRLKLGGQSPVCIDLIVGELAIPGCHLALEAEAVSEEGVPVLDLLPETMTLGRKPI